MDPRTHGRPHDQSGTSDHTTKKSGRNTGPAPFKVPAMNQHSIFLIAFLCIALPLTASAATISLSKTSSSMYTGTTDEFILKIDELPQGFTGYKLTATISNPAVAEIAAVSFPSWAPLSNTTTIPSSSVRISGVDMGGAVEPGATNIVLGTITVKAKNPGTATLTFGNIQVDDDSAGLVESSIGSATITVMSTSSGSGGGGGGGGGGGSYYSTTTTTAATTNATTKPTTSPVTTAPTSTATGVQPAGTQPHVTEEAPAVTETTSAASTPALAASSGSSLPLPLPLIIGFAIAVIAAIVLLALAVMGKL